MEQTGSASRPKIYRMPQLPATPQGGYGLQAARGVFMVAFLGALVIMLWSYRPPQGLDVSEALNTSTQKNIADGDSPSTTIAVRDDSGQIVGELTQMPSDVETGSAVNATAKVDPKSGKELLNIISKY